MLRLLPPPAALPSVFLTPGKMMTLFIRHTTHCDAEVFDVLRGLKIEVGEAWAGGFVTGV